MMNVFRAELSRLMRPGFLTITAVVVFAAGVLATAIVFLSAEDSAAPGPELGTTIQELSAAGGGTEAFSTLLSFGGFFVLVVLAAVWASEFSQGTFRTLLMKQPRRMFLLAGKFASHLVFGAGLLLLAVVVTWFASLAIAPAKEVSTSTWFSVDGLGEAAADYGNALFWVAVWSCFGMTLGVLIRSTPVSLAVGIGWFGPFERMTERAWDAASNWFPGLLLDSFVLGGTSDVSYVRALTLLVGYVAVAAAVSVVSFARRDVAG